jgi:hypothetical protein
MQDSKLRFRNQLKYGRRKAGTRASGWKLKDHSIVGSKGF